MSLATRPWLMPGPEYANTGEKSNAQSTETRPSAASHSHHLLGKNGLLMHQCTTGAKHNKR